MCHTNSATNAVNGGSHGGPGICSRKNPLRQPRATSDAMKSGDVAALTLSPESVAENPNGKLNGKRGQVRFA
jgi:hypothetical protein